ncbi:MAG: hypothetical protein WCP16_13600 [Pseudanabaena sp. ELA645]
MLAPKFKMYLVSRPPIELHIHGGNSVAEHLRLYELHDYFSNIDLKRDMSEANFQCDRS